MINSGGGEFPRPLFFVGEKMKHFIVAMTAVFLTAFSIPDNLVVVDSCDYVEINYVYNINEETGESKLRMTQYIWWEWRDSVLLPVLNPITKQRTGDWKQGGDFVVREYLVTYSGSSSPNKVADLLITKSNNEYHCIFWDKVDKVFRRVICKWRTTTHTTYDVEIENRNILNMNFRNEFQKR